MTDGERIAIIEQILQRVEMGVNRLQDKFDTLSDHYVANSRFRELISRVDGHDARLDQSNERITGLMIKVATITGTLTFVATVVKDVLVK